MTRCVITSFVKFHRRFMGRPIKIVTRAIYLHYRFISTITKPNVLTQKNLDLKLKFWLYMDKANTTVLLFKKWKLIYNSYAIRVHLCQ